MEKIRYRKILFQGLVLIIFYIFNSVTELEDNWLLLFLLGLWNSLFYISWFYKEIKLNENGFNPMIYYVGASIVYLGITFISTSLNILINGSVRLLTVYPKMFFSGALLLSFEQLLIALGFHISTKIFKNKKKIEYLKINYRKLAFTIYLIVIFSRIIQLENISVIFSYLNDYGIVVSIFIIIVERIQTNKFENNSKLLLFLFFISDVIYALSGDSKEQLMLPFVPFIIYFINLINLRKLGLFSKKIILQMSVILVILLYIVYPIVNIKRTHNNNFSKLGLINSFDNYYANEKDYYSSDVKNSQDALLQRLTLLTPYAWSIEYYKKKGALGPYFYINGFITIIPSFLLPNKPLYQPGKAITNLINGYPIWSSASTQTANGIGGTAYISGGIYLFISLSLVLGLFLGKIWQIIKLKLLSNPVYMLIYLIIIRSSIRFFENFMDGGITFYGITVFFLIFSLFSKRKLKKKKCGLKKG